MQKGSDRGFDWAALPVIATVARLLSAPRDGTPATDSKPRGQPEREVPGGELRAMGEPTSRPV